MKIVYIGAKPGKGDNVADTGLVWTRGQIHEVEDEKKAALLLTHKTVWADASKPYDLANELSLVKSQLPQFIVNSDDDLTDNYGMTLPVELVRQLHNGDLLPVFMTHQDADDFEAWKLGNGASPGEDLSPRNTGPTPERVEKKKAPEKKRA